VSFRIAFFGNTQSKDLRVGDEEFEDMLNSSISQFLVTFGLYELIMGSFSEITLEPDEKVPDSIQSQANLIWKGNYSSPGDEIEFWYIQQKSIIWFRDPNDWRFFGTGNDQDEEWLFKHIRDT
jgi:hypothetical protein